MQQEVLARWRKRLAKELAFRPEFSALDELAWRQLLKSRNVTSQNHDTVLSIDWPHYCANATKDCGGRQGWCYTFQGKQAQQLHNRHAAMVDVLARRFPEMFAEQVWLEVNQAVQKGLIRYHNLRYSGSGELHPAHLPALRATAKRGIRLWGFTRDVRLAIELRKINAGVIVSVDKSSPQDLIRRAVAEGLPIAYSSSGVNDAPPDGALVVFPVHRVGRVKEVVDAESLCPKVLAEFFNDTRPKSACQLLCQRCHLRVES